MSMFSESFRRVFDNEGGYTKDRRDRGNWTSGKVGVGALKGTKYGISAMTYPHLDIKNLSLNRARDIYYRDWWEKLQMGTLPKVLQYQMFDAAINHGMFNATKILQRAVGVNADGKIGRVTMNAVMKHDNNDILLLFLSERLAFMTRVKTWKVYGKGWARRIAHNLKLGAKDN